MPIEDLDGRERVNDDLKNAADRCECYRILFHKWKIFSAPNLDEKRDAETQEIAYQYSQHQLQEEFSFIFKFILEYFPLQPGEKNRFNAQNKPENEKFNVKDQQFVMVVSYCPDHCLYDYRK